MKDTSEMARFAEPWFLNFDATVEFLPAMIPKDLKYAGFDAIAKKSPPSKRRIRCPDARRRSGITSRTRRR